MKKRDAPAFTLLELCLGLTITSIIGLTAVTMAGVLSSRYSQSEAYFQSLQSARVALGKVQSQIRGAQLVTQLTSNKLMLWNASLNGDGKIHPADLVLLSYANGQITQSQLQYPDGWPTWLKTLLNLPVELDWIVTFPGVWDWWLAAGWFSSNKTLSTGVTGFSLSGDAAAPVSRTMSIQVTCGQGASAVTLRSCVGMRGDRTGSVALVGGDYKLLGL
jgi:hypothetical protein